MKKTIIRYTVLCITALIFPLCIQAQWDGLRHGKLPNGLTYYILHDEGSTGEAHFYLFQNVGAIVENDKQYGLAHFLEHMAFNTTEHFKGGVMSFLRNKGLTFNAQTGINETRFQVNNVSIKDKVLSDSVLLLLKDWCNGILFSGKDVEKERKIISEEWRQSRSVNKRLSDAIAPAIYNDSPYATHNVIGYESSLSKYTAKDIRNFYREWYRPELQCIAVIGDINPDEYESRIKQLFGTIPTSKVPVHRKDVTIPDNQGIREYHFVDRENASNSMGLYQRIYVSTDPGKRDFTSDNLMVKLFQRLASQQFARLRNDGKETYIAATMEYAPLVRSYAQNSWDVVPYAGKELQALRQLLAVREKIQREGFTEQEFENAKWDLYNELKTVIKDGNLGTPDNIMDIFKQNYLYGQPIETFKQQITHSMELLVEMEAGDLNKWIRSWMDDKNLAFITYSANPKEMDIPGTQVSRLLKEVEAAPVMTFAQPAGIKELLPFSVTPGKIAAEKDLKDLGVKEWTLGNGAKVLYKYLPKAGDKVYFAGSAMGGTSAVATRDIPSESAMQALIMQSGLYQYNRNQLSQWLQNKDIQLSLSITDYTDGIGGNVSLKNVDDFFKYLYLVVNKQNFNKDVFDKFVERKQYLYANRSKTGMGAVRDSIKYLLYPPSEANPKEDDTFYKRMKYEDLQRLFNDRFGNAANFTFCLIGAVPEEQARQLVRQYIASLPGKPGSKPRSYQVRELSSPARDITRVFQTDVEGDMGEVEISYINSKPLTEKEELTLTLLKELLQSRLFDELREREGGVYSIGVDATYSPLPKPVETVKIHFTTQRDKADSLKEKAYGILDEIRHGNISEGNFKKASVPLAVNQEAEERMAEQDGDRTENDPMLWLALLNSYAENGKVPDNGKTAGDISYANLTPKDVSSLLNKILDGAKKRDITVKSLPATNGVYH